MAIGTLWSVTLDCAEPEPLGRFWAQVLGGEVAHTSADFVGISTPGGLWIGAYRVADYQAPLWSADASTKQFHLDLAVADLDVAEEQVLALGGTKATHQPEPERWRVLIDPAGHPFCVTNQAPV